MLFGWLDFLLGLRCGMRRHNSWHASEVCWNHPSGWLPRSSGTSAGLDGIGSLLWANQAIHLCKFAQLFPGWLRSTFPPNNHRPPVHAPFGECLWTSPSAGRTAGDWLLTKTCARYKITADDTDCASLSRYVGRFSKRIWGFESCVIS